MKKYIKNIWDTIANQASFSLLGLWGFVAWFSLDYTTTNWERITLGVIFSLAVVNWAYKSYKHTKIETF